MRCMPSCSSAPRRPPTRTAGSPQCCATRSARTPAARTHSAATPTGCSRGCILGAAVDLDETYEWGLRSTGKPLSPNRSRLPDRLYPGVVGQPRRCAGWTRNPAIVVHGTDALQAWMQDLSDRAVECAGRHALRHRRSRCARSSAGSRRPRPAASTTPARPRTSAGPAGCGGRCRRASTTFHTWQETTTVFHEGVPGHHLQIGRAVVLAGPAEPLAAAGLLGVGARRGLGAVRRAADGRPRLARRRRQPDGNA